MTSMTDTKWEVHASTTKSLGWGTGPEEWISCHPRVRVVVRDRGSTGDGGGLVKAEWRDDVVATTTVSSEDNQFHELG